MMADDSYVQEIRYTADISDIQGKLNSLANKQDDAEGQTKTSAGKMSKHWDGVKDSVAKISVGIGLIGGAAILAVPKILEGGAALEGLEAKARTVFEGSLGSVDKWATENAKAMGLTTSQARDAAAAMADLLKPMGFNAEQAATMSTDMVGLSGALSAWTGGTQTAAEVSDIMSKAMLGERDGLKALGISISEADVQARLAANGTAGLTGAALEQAKAIATQQLIMEKSTDAQKAWSDGSMDAAKQQNASKASIAQLKESLTTALYPALVGILPAVTKIAEWLGTHLPVAIEKVKVWFEENWPKIQDAAEKVVKWFNDDARPVIEAVVAAIMVAFDKVKVWTEEHWPEIQATIAAVIDAIKVIVETTLTVIKVLWETFGENIIKVIGAAMDIVKGIIQTVTAIIRGDWGKAWDGIKAILSGVWEAIKGIVGLALDALKLSLDLAWAGIKAAVGLAWDGIKALVSSAVDGIVGFVTGIPGRLVGLTATMFAPIKDAIDGAKNWVSDRIDDVVGFATALPGRMVGLFVGMFDGIKDAFRSSLNWIIGKWNGLSFSLPEVDTHIPGVGKVGGWSINTPNIPTFHTGGTVPGLTGSDVLALVSGGETIRTPRQEAALQQGRIQNFYGDIQVVSNEKPRAWFDEGLWRVAG